MKSFVVATLVASAAAFAPVSQRASSPTAISAANKFANELGAQAPLGFFDPMGFLGPEDDTQFQWLREAEIKHGRISMLAVVGYLTTYAGYRIPGMEDVPCGFGVFDKTVYTTDLALNNVRWTIATMLILETAIVKDGYDLAEFPGDYLNGFGKIRWDGRSADFQYSSRAKELNNGRAAMMGILGLMVHESMGNVDQILPFLNK
mmetsp:Transcript_23886/g.36325  ORF Transcript_23886/g.36325 Transcript_23886/m.36325 type:complete len:204 (-) Transcript_23886:110-721(-)